MADRPATLTATRLALQQVAVHVLARRRHAATGRFGLRPSPGGIATPAFGDEAEVVRTSGRYVLVERSAGAAIGEMATLGHAAATAGIELPDHDDEFSVGDDTPAMVDPDHPLALDAAAVELLAAWYGFGSVVIDQAVAIAPGRVVATTTRQLWPEHFDLGGSVTLARRNGGPDDVVKANVGASPGDDFDPSPYLYLGPWDAERPGDATYWNAPFGAVLRYDDVTRGSPTAQRAQALDFLVRGLQLLAAG